MSATSKEQKILRDICEILETFSGGPPAVIAIPEEGFSSTSRRECPGSLPNNRLAGGRRKLLSKEIL